MFFSTHWLLLVANVLNCIREAAKKVLPIMALTPELNGHRNSFFSLMKSSFFLNGPSFTPAPPLNGLAISGGNFFATSLLPALHPFWTTRNKSNVFWMWGAHKKLSFFLHVRRKQEKKLYFSSKFFYVEELTCHKKVSSGRFKNTL